MSNLHEVSHDLSDVIEHEIVQPSAVSHAHVIGNNVVSDGSLVGTNNESSLVRPVDQAESAAATGLQDQGEISSAPAEEHENLSSGPLPPISGLIPSRYSVGFLAGFTHSSNPQWRTYIHNVTHVRKRLKDFMPEYFPHPELEAILRKLPRASRPARYGEAVLSDFHLLYDCLCIEDTHVILDPWAGNGLIQQLNSAGLIIANSLGTGVQTEVHNNSSQVNSCNNPINTDMYIHLHNLLGNIHVIMTSPPVDMITMHL